jgi:multicomponent Na+:H+ antiporter subunit E
LREDGGLVVSNKGLVGESGKPNIRFKAFFSFLITFILLFISWIVLSGKFEPLLLWLGAISSFFVAFYFYDLLFPALEANYAGIFLRFIGYIPWLLWEIMKANLHLLYLAFHPRMIELIDPHIITFKTNLKSDIAITTLANSITLTPGTITVTATSEGVFTVHAIDRSSAEALPGTMLEKVARVFGEQI